MLLNNPGFVVAALDLPKLLKHPELRDCVDPLSCSPAGESVFFCVIRKASSITMAAFMDAYPALLKVDLMRPLREPLGFRNNGTTALHYAVNSQSPAKVQLLFTNGADVMAVNSRCQLPLDLIWEFGHGSDELQIIRALIHRMGVENLSLKNRSEALLVSVKHDLSEVLDWLLEAGVNPDVRSPPQSQWTVLHEAVMRDSRKVIKLLVEAKPDFIGKTDVWGRTPLFLAKNCDTIRLLITSGADVFALDRWGSTAMHHLYRSYQQDLIIPFREHASRSEADGERGVFQRLFRMKNEMGEVAADVVHFTERLPPGLDEHRIPKWDSIWNEYIQEAVAHDGEQLYEFGNPEIVANWENQSSEGRRPWKEVLEKFAEEELKGKKEGLTTSTGEEIEFATRHLEWHAKRSKELADQYEINKREIADKASEKGNQHWVSLKAIGRLINYKGS